MPISPYVRALREKVGHDLLALQSATVIVFDDVRRLLLAQSAESGLWMTIGGANEPGEVPADAAIRVRAPTVRSWDCVSRDKPVSRSVGVAEKWLTTIASVG
jgi:NUDIX domain